MALTAACSRGPTPEAEGERTTRTTRRVTTVQTLSGRPSDVAYVDGVLWVVEDEAGTVQRLDATTGEPIGAPIPVSQAPGSVAVGGGKVVVADAFGQVAILDAGSPTPAEPAVQVGRAFADVAVDGDRIWVADIGLGTVSQVDAGGATVWQTEVPSGAVRLAPVGDRLWVSGIENTIVALDAATGRLVEEPIRVGEGPIGLAASDHVLWVANSDDDTVSRLDPRTGRSLGVATAVGRAPIAVAVDGAAVWVLDQDSPAVTLLDATTGARRGSDTPLPLRPRGFAVSPAGLWIVGVDPPSAVLVPRT